MDDKRTALAVLLCIFVFMFWFELVMTPYRQQPAAPGAAANPSAAVQPATSAQAPVVGAPVTTTTGTTAPLAGAIPANAAPLTAPHAAAEQIAAAGEIVINSEHVEIRIARLGGRLSHYRLKQYKRMLGVDEPLDVVATAAGAPLPLGLYLGTQNDELVSYTVTSATLSDPLKAGDAATGTAIDTNAPLTIAPNMMLTLNLNGQLPAINGAPARTISKTFRIRPDQFTMDLQATVADAPASTPLWVEWTRSLTELEVAARLNPEQLSILSENNKVTHVQLAQIPTGVAEAGQAHWISFGDKYFMASLAADAPADAAKSALTTPAGSARYGRNGGLFFTQLDGSISQGGTAVLNTFIFIGPKYHSELAKIGHQLERNVDLGWFSFIAQPILLLIKSMYNILGNYGLAIILLTLIIKMAFLPLTKASFKSMKGMQEIQPEMKALRERIKDPQQLNKEVMALYKKHGVNPAGGCLPMLIQLPVFLGLYNALLNSVELRHAPFALWITDLSAPEHLDFFGVGIPVMVLIMGASMFLQQYTTPSSADPTQRRIMLMMPFILTISFVIFPFPSGLVLYWLVNNLISIVQQMYLRSEQQVSPGRATVVASLGIFSFGYILTLI